MHSLGKVTWLKTLDTNLGYCKVPIVKANRDKTTFSYQLSTYIFRRVPFDLTNVLPTFQCTLDVILSGFNWQSCLIHLNDVIVCSQTLDAHLKDMDIVLFTLCEASVFFNLKKCCSSKNSVKNLRHIIKLGALSINEARVERLN